MTKEDADKMLAAVASCCMDCKGKFARGLSSLFPEWIWFQGEDKYGLFVAVKPAEPFRDNDLKGEK